MGKRVTGAQQACDVTVGAHADRVGKEVERGLGAQVLAAKRQQPVTYLGPSSGAPRFVVHCGEHAGVAHQAVDRSLQVATQRDAEVLLEMAPRFL
jgi:hypothetical protein